MWLSRLSKVSRARLSTVNWRWELGAGVFCPTSPSLEGFMRRSLGEVTSVEIACQGGKTVSQPVIHQTFNGILETDSGTRRPLSMLERIAGKICTVQAEEKASIFQSEDIK